MSVVQGVGAGRARRRGGLADELRGRAGLGVGPDASDTFLAIAQQSDPSPPALLCPHSPPIPPPADEEGTRASTIVCGALLFLDHSRPALGAEMLRYLAAFGLDDLDPIACLMRGWGAQALPARARTAACNVAQACGSGDFSGVAEDLRILSILMRQAITVTCALPVVCLAGQ